MPEEQLWGRNTANGQEIIYDICNRQPSPPPTFQSCQDSRQLPAASATGHGHLVHPLSPTSPEYWGGGPCSKAGSLSPQHQPGHTQQHRHRDDPGVCPGAGQGERAWGQSPKSDRNSRAFPSPGHGQPSCKGMKRISGSSVLWKGLLEHWCNPSQQKPLSLGG